LQRWCCDICDVAVPEAAGANGASHNREVNYPVFVDGGAGVISELFQFRV